MGFPIRKFTDQSLFAAPHDLSQRTTSFFASQRQGIHQIPLRHLIALITNAQSPRRRPDHSIPHPSRPSDGSFLRFRRLAYKSTLRSGSQNPRHRTRAGEFSNNPLCLTIPCRDYETRWPSIKTSFASNTSRSPAVKQGPTTEMPAGTRELEKLPRPLAECVSSLRCHR